LEFWNANSKNVNNCKQKSKTSFRLKRRASEYLFYFFRFVSVLGKRCETKRKHAKNFVIGFAKRCQNHAKRFVFRFHFACKRKKCKRKRDTLVSAECPVYLWSRKLCSINMIFASVQAVKITIVPTSRKASAEYVPKTTVQYSVYTVQRCICLRYAQK
jgi:hypothetical protein